MVELINETVISEQFESVEATVSETIIENKIDMICPKASNSENNMVSEAYEKNISVRNWGIKDEKDLINAYNSGSKGTTIDWPTRGKEVILKYENNKISN